MPHSTFLNLPEEKKTRIIDASVKEFLNRQYEKASINKIIKSANIPRGSFYQYFENKEDLYFYCLSEIYKDVFKELYEKSFSTLSTALENIPAKDWPDELHALEGEIVSIIGEEKDKFLATVFSAPKHIQQSYFMNIFTTRLKPFLFEILQENKSIRDKSNIDFFAFLLSMTDFLIMEYGNLQSLNGEQKTKYSRLYLDMIFQNLIGKHDMQEK